MEMVEKKEWKDFRKTGLLLFINSFLHIFGWAIVFQFDEKGNVQSVYPARVKFRGFDPKSQGEAFEKLHDYLKENIDEIHSETFEK